MDRRQIIEDQINYLIASENINRSTRPDLADISKVAETITMLCSEMSKYPPKGK